MKSIAIIALVLSSVMIVKSQNCAGQNNAASCVSQAQANGLKCCWMTASVAGISTTMCSPLAATSVNAGTTSVGGVSYSYDCAGTTNVGTDQCLAQNSKTITSKYFCTDYSTTTNSCCMYETNGTKKCMWLGSKFDGETTYGGQSLKCSSSFLSTSLLFAFLLVLSFF